MRCALLIGLIVLLSFICSVSATDGCVGASTTFICGDKVNESCTMNASLNCNTSVGLTIDADNIIIDGAGFTINGQNNDSNTNIWGISATGRNNITLKNITITKFGDRTLPMRSGGNIQFSGVNSTFQDIVISYGFYGFYMSNGNSTYPNNFNNIHITNNSNDGFILQDSNNNFNNITANDSEDTGMLVLAATNNTFTNCNFSNNGWAGLSLSDANNSYFSNISVSGSFGDGGEGYGLYLTESVNNTFNLLTAKNSLTSDLALNYGVSDNNIFIDYSIGTYQIDSSSSSKLIFNNTLFGQLRYLSGIHTNNSIRNLTDLQFTNNSVYVNSTGNPFLNVSTNISLNLVDWNFVNPVILRDGWVCNASSSNPCYNITNLSGGKMENFNVTSWCAYEIGEYNISGDYVSISSSSSSSSYATSTSSSSYASSTSSSSTSSSSSLQSSTSSFAKAERDRNQADEDTDDNDYTTTTHASSTTTTEPTTTTTLPSLYTGNTPLAANNQDDLFAGNAVKPTSNINIGSSQVAYGALITLVLGIIGKIFKR